MNEELTQSKAELNPQEVAEQQVAVARSFATLYAGPSNEKSITSAEIVLRNPLAYLRDVSLDSLPETLGERWRQVNGWANDIADKCVTERMEWGQGLNGLEKLQNLVDKGKVDPFYRDMVAGVMVSSSNVFAESTKHVPGNTRYFEGNVIGAMNRLNYPAQ